MSAFVDALRSAAQGSGTIVTGEPKEPVRTSWTEIHRRARAGATVLAEFGLQTSQAVAILAGQPLEVAPAAQAVWLAGGSVTMLHQPTPRTRLDHYATETLRTLTVIGARLVVVGRPFLDVVEMLRANGIDALTVDELAAGDPDAAPEISPDDDDPALLQLTSGSTATPKAVRITHRNLWASIEAMTAAADLRAGRDVMVSWLPLFHDMGMVGFLTLPMCRGLDLVKVSPADFLGNPGLWPELISKYHGTCTAAPNFAYAITARVLSRGAADLDLSSMRFALNGAEPIDVPAMQGFLAAGQRFGLPDTAMVCAYGMAEATLGVSFHEWGTPMEVERLDAVELEEHKRAVIAADDANPVRTFPVLGPPLAGIEVTVKNELGHDLPARKVGVLHLRGECVTSLYLTVDGPRPTRNDDGWLDTGDLGYLTEAGHVVVCGRVKDIIIMGGRNIYPTDIERAAEKVDGVRAGNAVAVRFAEEGRREAFAVLVESREAGDPDAVKRIAAQVRSVVTAQIGARPARVEVLPVGSLPKTPSGKHQRAKAAGLLLQA